MDSELIRALLARETPLHDAVGRTRVLAEKDEEAVVPTPSSSALDPYLVSLLGGLADTGSTYAFLKRGTATEDNALVSGLSKHPKTMAALGTATNIALPLLLKHTLGKKFPKIAQALAANQGALQAGYGAINTQHTLDSRRSRSGEGRNTSIAYTNSLLSHLNREIR